MNTKSKYPSVQAAVDDMMHRSGLSNYLDTVKESQEQIPEEKATKTAQFVPGKIKAQNMLPPAVSSVLFRQAEENACSTLESQRC